MAGSSPQQDVFDIRKIRRLVELMKEHDLSEVDLRQGDMRIQLRSDSAPIVSPPVVGVPSPLPPAVPQPVQASASAEPVESEHHVLIRSPMVGTFYASPDPESPVYVKVGDHVGPDTTVCIIEAMKVYNQIPAEVSGKIVAVLIENGEPVEFGQPVFRVDKRES